MQVHNSTRLFKWGSNLVPACFEMWSIYIVIIYEIEEYFMEIMKKNILGTFWPLFQAYFKPFTGIFFESNPGGPVKVSCLIEYRVDVPRHFRASFLDSISFSRNFISICLGNMSKKSLHFLNFGPTALVDIPRSLIT